MGSANINDRSQKGDGDSEIALVVEDTDMIETRMDGKTYMAARFAASLRRKLYRGIQQLCSVSLKLMHLPDLQSTLALHPRRTVTRTIL